MDTAADGFVELRRLKGGYLNAFYALIIGNLLLRLVEANASQGVAALFGLGLLGVAVCFVVLSYRFARALGIGIGSTIALLVLSIVPLINLIVVYCLIRSYKKTTGTATSFFMFDVAKPAP